MASPARQLSNYYEVLGLSHDASQDEVGAAFERAMGNFARPLSATLQIYQAFEVLRQPDKRRAYDGSIGIARDARPRQFLIRSEQGAFTVAARASSKVEPVMPVGNDRQKDTAAVPAPPPQKPAPRIEAAKPAVKPFLAQISASEEVVQTPQPAPLAEIAPAPAPAEPYVLAEPAGDRELDALVESIMAEGHAEKAALRSSERRPHDWRRIGIAAGALMVGAGILGGMAGVYGSESASADNAVDVALPEPSPYLAGTAPSRDFDAEAEAQVRAENAVKEARQLVASTPERNINPPIVPLGVEIAQARPPKAVPAAEAPKPSEAAATTTVDPLAPTPEETTAAAQPSQLPLPNATIARTIQKIGYPCGAVSSVAPVEAGGVFKVTCSSGHSYRAAPTAGRYRFKKWGGA